MSLNLINFPYRADSTFTGKSAGFITVESVHRRTPANGTLSNNDYVAVLRDTAGSRAVVPYSRLVAAFRSRDPATGLRTLFAEAQNSGVRTAAVAAPVPAGPIAGGTTLGYAGATTVTPVPKAIPAPPAPRVLSADTPAEQLIDADTALNLMTALVKASRRDPKIANVVKTLAALV